jgi:hypothetical protein
MAYRQKPDASGPVSEKKGKTMSDLWDIFVDHHLIHGLSHQIKRGEPQGIAIHFNGVKQHFF